MTKLDQLNVFLSERLSAAVNEILHTVSRMMQEYEEETARVRKENEYLREMLTLTGWSFTELNPGVSPGGQDGSNPLHETWEGWCPNPALKEESTSIKIEQPDPPYLAHPESEYTDKCPTPVLGTSSPISAVRNSAENCKGKAKIKLRKKHYCLYCKKPFHRMTQHLLSAHAKEPEVAKALSYDKKSKERKQLLNLLQSKGSLLHKDVEMSKTAVSSKRHAKTGSNKADVQCVYCLGLYSRKVLVNHVKRCKRTHSSRAETAAACLVSSSAASQQGASSCKTTPEGNQANAVACSGKQNSPHPDRVRPHTEHSAAQLHTDTQSAAAPDEDFGSFSEPLLAAVESQSELGPDISSPVGDRTETNSEDNKSDAEQSDRNGPAVHNRRRSFHAEPQLRLFDIPSEETESAAQNTQPHICQHCSATFCSPYHLRRHEYTHTGERPFWCSECNVGFIQKYRYRNHRMVHHERQISLSKDQSGRRKKRSCSGETPAENELHQQQLAESGSGTTEASSDYEERV